MLLAMNNNIAVAQGMEEVEINNHVSAEELEILGQFFNAKLNNMNQFNNIDLNMEPQGRILNRNDFSPAIVAILINSSDIKFENIVHHLHQLFPFQFPNHNPHNVPNNTAYFMQFYY